MMRFVLPMLLLCAGPCAAAEAYYETYAAGLPVAGMLAEFEVGAERYRMAIDFHTSGAVNLMFRSRERIVASGRFAGDAAAPVRFTSSGVMKGETRVTEIDYVGGQPVIRQLTPPVTREREAVPEGLQRDTVDQLSALAGLLHRVSRTGRCEGEVATYDGRRLATLRAWTAGTQVLEASGRSVFAGPALRCEFLGRQTGGFLLDVDRESLMRPQEGSAWFAAVDGVMLPVRIAFHTRWFGDATMYLAAKPQ